MKAIKILGCGLSGMASAINLAKKGYEVELFEQNKDVGMRFHGDLQGLENWTTEEDVLAFLKRINVEIDFGLTPVSVITITNTKEEKELKFKRPFFYLVKRGPMKGSIDQGLKKLVLEAGAKINFEKTIPTEEADIVATGPNPKRLGAIAKGIVFEINMSNIAVELLSNEYAYQGYSYLLVAENYGCLCTTVTKRFNKLESCFKKTKKYFIERYRLKIRNPKTVGGAVTFSLNGPYKKNQTYFVGEAAGIQDGLAGFGMRTAMTSGYLAAESIIEGKNYDKVAKDWFEGYLKAGVINRYIWEKADVENNLGIFSKIIKMGDPILYLRSRYNFSALKEAEFLIAYNYAKKEYPNLR